MKLPALVLVVVISFFTAFITVNRFVPVYLDNWGLVSLARPNGPPPSDVHGVSYDHVVRTGVLRCGYQYWDNAVMRDDKTGQVHGAWVDMMEAIGLATGLKIEWPMQVSWSDVGAALKTHKIDAMCAGMWTSAAKAKEINFTSPLAYQAIEAFVRADDHHFDGGLKSLNDEKIKIAVIENDNSDFIARQEFPKAQRIALGQSFATDGDLLLEVMTGKADVTFTVAGLWHQFEKANPHKIRRLSPGTKLRVFGLANAVDSDEPRLLQLLNAGEQEIQNSGMLDKILDAANTDIPDMYIKSSKPFP